jgi:hypothetical protein
MFFREKSGNPGTTHRRKNGLQWIWIGFWCCDPTSEVVMEWSGLGLKAEGEKMTVFR